jgi:hypothetical protein
MLNIFVISSDKRVESLLRHFQPFFKSKIRSASDFDNGLKEVFENRPSVVFIQSMIGTVSGETVSRHIKSLLGTESPRIVFMGDSDSSGKKGTSWCDDWIRISDSEQQMQQDFAELFERCFPQDWREIREEMEKTASTVADIVPETLFSEESISADVSSLHREGDDAGSCLTGDAAEEPLQEKSGASAADISAVDKDFFDNEVFHSDQNLYGDFSLESDIPRTRRRPLVRLLAAVLLLAAAGVGVYYWMLRNDGIQMPATQPPSASKSAVADRPASPPATTKGDIKGLPSFVRREWRDPLYTSQHPGWERYVSPETEFRIFRENGTIKALQGISRGQGGMSEDFLVHILKQFGLNGPLPVAREDLKNGFLVKSSVFPGGTELVTYQEQGGSQLKAFVVEFSWSKN